VGGGGGGGGGWGGGGVCWCGGEGGGGWGWGGGGLGGGGGGKLVTGLNLGKHNQSLQRHTLATRKCGRRVKVQKDCAGKMISTIYDRRCIFSSN